MLFFYKKYWRTCIDVGLLITTVYGIMYICSKLYVLGTPIFLSFIVFWIIEPFARFLHTKGLPKVLGSAVSVLVFLMLFMSIFFGLVVLIISQLSTVTQHFPVYTTTIQTEFIKLTNVVQHKIATIPPEFTEKANEYFAFVTDSLSKWVVDFLQRIVELLGSFSSFMVHCTIAIILAFFLSLESKGWQKFFSQNVSNTFKQMWCFITLHVLKKIVSYLKAQLFIVSITFFMVYVGLLLLQTNSPFTVAIICAIFDVLPILGVSFVFVPWIIYLCMISCTSLATWLFVLFVFVILTRQLIEPKISGHSIGVSSSFLMFSFMLVSLSLFGLAGVILSPVLLILLNELYRQGYLKKWIFLPKDDLDPLSN